jgi:predicted nucleic acid-binding protein
MSGDFLDSNIFIYMYDDIDARKRTVARELVAAALSRLDTSISFQVVQETLRALTTKLMPPLTHPDATRFLDEVLAPLWRVMPTPALYQRCLDLQARYNYTFYDSLILAAALQAGCTRLLSEDFHHGQRIEGLTLENPFRD